jgi:hypothetical protein
MGKKAPKPPKSPLGDIEEAPGTPGTPPLAAADNDARRTPIGGAPSAVGSPDPIGAGSPVKSPTPKGGSPLLGPVSVDNSPPQLAAPAEPQKQPSMMSGLPAPGSVPITAPAQPSGAAKKHGLADDFHMRIPEAALRILPESAAPIEAQLAPVARNAGVVCSRFCALLGRLVLAVRLVLSLPIGLVLAIGIGVLVLLMFLQLLWLLPLALLLGLLLPNEPQAKALPMTMPAQHVVVLGGGAGLSRAVALECVRRGADVTVLAAGTLQRRLQRSAL